MVAPPGRRRRQAASPRKRETGPKSTIDSQEMAGSLLHSAAADLGLQPGAGEGPVAVGGRRRHSEHLGGPLAGQPPKIAQLDQPRPERGLRRPLRQRPVPRDQPPARPPPRRAARVLPPPAAP